MKRAFIYKDEEKSKFWWIDYSGCDFAVNYGNIGETGTFEVKKFDTEEECAERAEKRIRSKVKKGYVEVPNFDFMNILYIDSEEHGLHPKTSHPRFAEHFIEEFYYDDTDEEAPFGEPDAYDALRFLEEIIIKNPEFDFLDYPQYLIKHRWRGKYYPAEPLEPNQVKELDEQTIFDMTQSDYVTYASALGQIKISGMLSPNLQEQGINAIKRLSILNGEGLTEIQNKVVEDLLSFPTIKEG